MGSDHRGAITLTETVRVVPDVPSFAVDDGFAYSVPEGMELEVGHIVRVPLSGRRVRGWVISTRPQPSTKTLKAVLSRSGDLPVFDARLLEVIRWAAAHYVAPMSAVLGKVTPPNLPKGAASSMSPPAGERGLRVWSGRGPWAGPIAEAAAPLIAAGQSVIVVAPTWVEAEDLADGLAETFGDAVIAASSHLSGAQLTAAWVRAATKPGQVIVGTRDIAWWRAPAIGGAFVVEDGRRGLKEKAMPTVHARDLLLKRASVERWPLTVCGLVVSPEALSRAAAVERPWPGRQWGQVEVVDRRDEPPGRSLFGDTASAALRAAVSGGRRVLILTHRRRGAQRCVTCRLLRACRECGAAPGAGDTCERCGREVGRCTSCGGARFEPMGAAVPRLISEAARIVGAEAVGTASDARAVIVGTERDLVGLQVDLTIVPDADGMLMASNYRAAEDALRVMARGVAAAGPGSGRKAIVQTLQPAHPVIDALRTGDPIPALRDEAASRADAGFPPGGEVLAVEVTSLPEDRHRELVERIGHRASVHGPAPINDRLRWLVQGRDLAAARTVLRPLVSEWREAGVRVRVDADPIDL